MANGIDIVIQDSISDAIVTKLTNIATRAEAAAKSLDKVTAAMSKMGKGGSGAIAASVFGDIGSGSKSKNSRRVEPANVTATKQLEKQRKDIAGVFERGLADREKAARISDGIRQREARAEALYRRYIASENEKAIKDQQKQAAAQAKIDASNLKARDKNRQEVTAVFERGFRDREKAASDAIKRIERATASQSINYDKLLGVGTATASASQRNASQRMYNDLFGAHNLTTAPLVNNVKSVIDNTITQATRQISSTQRKAQQQMYNSLFGAQPVANLANQINQIQGIGAPKAPASQRSAQQQMYNNLFGAQQRSASVSPISATATRGVQQYTSSLAGAVTGTNNLSGAMTHLQTSTSFLRSDGLRWAKVMWALAGATLTAGAIVDSADAYTRLQNRLSVVADTQAQVNTLTEDMLRISVAARQPIEEVAKSFARFDLAVQQLGRSQSDTLVITENVSKALKLGGATAGESASALLQLSQAFNKGKLDGDEFRSLMENSPILADALAKKLGVARGELLKLAPQGKITLQVMTDAIMGATDDINKAFAKLKPTIAESFTVLRSQAIVFFGELDKQLGVTSALSSLIIGLSQNLDVLTFAIMAVTPALALFVGTKVLAGFATLIAFGGRAAIAIGAIRSPVTIVAASIANMGRQAIASGAVMNAVFTNATTRAVALRFAVVGAAAAVLTLGNAAARAGSMMLAAFSFGNIVLVIGTLVAAAIAFGDQIVLSAEKSTTLRDYTIAAFQEIGDFGADVFNTLYDNISSMFGSSANDAMTTGEKIKSVLNTVGIVTAVTIDSVLTVFGAVPDVVKSVVYLLGDAVYNSVALVVNAVTSLVNGAIDGLNALSSVANLILNATGASSIVGNFGKIGQLAGMEYKSQFVDSLGNFSVSTAAIDAYDEFSKRVSDRADKRAADRAKADKLRAAGESNLTPDASKASKAKKGKSPEEKRADIIAKVVRAETAAIKTAQLLGDEREKTSVITDLNNKLEEKGLNLLTASETAHISALVQQRLEAERVGEAMQTIYGNTQTKLIQDRTAAIAAANNMLASGMITQEHANNLIIQANRVFAAATNPITEYTQQLDRARAVLGKFGVEADIASAMYDKAQQLIEDGKPPMTPEQSQALISAVTDTYKLTKAQEALNSVFGETSGAVEDVYRSMDALGGAYERGWLSLDEYIKRSAGLTAEMGRLREQQFGVTDPVEPFRRGFNQLLADMPSIGQQMADTIQNTLGSAIDSVAGGLTTLITDFSTYADQVASALERPVSTLDVMRYMLSDIVKQIGVDLIQATIKMGIQWAIQSTMRRALAQGEQAQAAAMQASTIATNSLMAAALTNIWTPPAVLASIATNGEAAVSGATSVAAAMAATKGMSLLDSAVPAFADGSGILKGSGTSRSDSLLARLSSGEMVMNATAVKEHYPALASMQKGDYTGSGVVYNNTNVYITYADGSTTTSTDANDKKFANDLKNFVDSRFQQLQKDRSRQGHEGYKYG